MYIICFLAFSEWPMLLLFVCLFVPSFLYLSTSGTKYSIDIAHVRAFGRITLLQISLTQKKSSKIYMLLSLTHRHTDAYIYHIHILSYQIYPEGESRHEHSYFYSEVWYFCICFDSPFFGKNFNMDNLINWTWNQIKSRLSTTFSLMRWISWFLLILRKIIIHGVKIIPNCFLWKCRNNWGKKQNQNPRILVCDLPKKC